MKKTIAIMGVALFALSFGVAYANSGLYNGVTDFSGKSHDTFEIGPAANIANDAYESSAPGSRRMVANETSMSHDMLEATPGPMTTSIMRRNFAGKESSVRTYDLFEIQR